MIKHDLIPKGSMAHVLITSSTFPRVLIPAKVLIKDSKFDISNPKYLVKIVKFYDSAYFIRKYLLRMQLSNGLNRRASYIFDSNLKFKKIENFENYLDQHGEKYYIVVDSVMTVRHKSELQDLFLKVQDFLILQSIRELRENMTRNLYYGKFKMKTKTEFDNRLKSMIGDRVSKTHKEYEFFVNRLQDIY